MRRNVFSLVFTLLMALCAAVLVSAQTVTVEPPVTATVIPTIGVTAEATVAVTPEATVISAAPTAQPTAQATSAVPVTPAAASTPSDQSAYLRFAHFSPDAPGIDVYVNGSLMFRDMAYPSMSQWIALPPGSEAVIFTQTGQPISSPLLDTTNVSASAGMWDTVALVGSNANKTLQAALISEDYSALLPSTGSLTFFNAVEGSSPMSFVRNNVVYFAQIGFPGPNTSSSSSLHGDSGTFAVSAVDPNHPATVFASEPTLAQPENAYTFVALIGTPGSERFFTLVTDESAVELVRGLLPPPGTLMDAMRTDTNLTAFAQALQNTGLDAMLNDGSQTYTIFAPANFTMSGAMSGDQLATALKAYIVQGKYTGQQLLAAKTLTALDGSTLTITTHNNALFVNGVQIIDLNVAATNGVVHMIDGLFGQAAQ